MRRRAIGNQLSSRRSSPGVEKVARRSRQAVEPGHHEHVAGVEPVEDAAKLDAIIAPLAVSRHTFRAPAALSWRT
jgi:hypothetical protein